jgi:hypothetical protein
VPTAYMVFPHWANCRTIIVVDDVAGRCGVHGAGVVETGPLGAAYAIGVVSARASTEPATPTTSFIAKRILQPPLR